MKIINYYLIKKNCGKDIYILEKETINNLDEIIEKYIYLYKKRFVLKN